MLIKQFQQEMFYGHASSPARPDYPNIRSGV